MIPEIVGIIDKNQPKPVLSILETKDLIGIKNESGLEITEITCLVSGSYTTEDDQIIESDSPQVVSYSTVKPDQWVKLDDNNLIFHDDFTITYRVEVQFNDQSSVVLEFTRFTGVESGKILLWSDGQTGEYINRLP